MSIIISIINSMTISKTKYYYILINIDNVFHNIAHPLMSTKNSAGTTLSRLFPSWVQITVREQF